MKNQPVKRPLLVRKYGGSSLATPEQIRSAAERVAEVVRQGTGMIVVVSAMGKTTDQLVELAYRLSPAPNRRELDMLLTTGERVSMALMSMALNDLKILAISFTGSQAGVLTDDSHSNARILDIKPVRVDTELANGRVVVLAGFQGVSPETKEVTTLGRGGSDTTAVAMAAHFNAERCEIRKDVDGVYSADPKQVPGASHLPHLHYSQLLEMTFWGAKVLHYRSVELASVLNIPLVVALADGDERQTLINGDFPMYEKGAILSVNSHKDVRWLVVNKSSISTAAQEMHACLNQHGLPSPQLLDSEQRDANQWAFLVTGPPEVLNAIAAISADATAGSADIVIDERPLSTVSATCQGSFTSTLTMEVLEALARRGIQVRKMLFSAMTLSVLIDSVDREEAERTLHSLRPL